MYSRPADLDPSCIVHHAPAQFMCKQSVQGHCMGTGTAWPLVLHGHWYCMATGTACGIPTVTPIVDVVFCVCVCRWNGHTTGSRRRQQQRLRRKLQRPSATGQRLQSPAILEGTCRSDAPAAFMQAYSCVPHGIVLLGNLQLHAFIHSPTRSLTHSCVQSSSHMV